MLKHDTDSSDWMIPRISVEEYKRLIRRADKAGDLIALRYDLRMTKGVLNRFFVRLRILKRKCTP